MSNKDCLLLLSIKISCLIFIFSQIISKDIYSQASSNIGLKRGGVCFRTDDNQPISHYLEYASLFNTYNQKFTFSINLGQNEMTADYLNGIRQLQASGHEMMDHTPAHVTNRFNTILDPGYYVNHPGVHNISGNTIELNHATVDINSAKRSGYGNVDGDIITSPNGIFSSFAMSDCYLYFPTINQLVFIDPNGWIDPNTVYVYDFWYNSIWLGSHQNIQFYNFDYDNIHLTIEGLKALTEESVRLSNHYNLIRPLTWIQPGCYSPHISSYELKQSCGGELGFCAGAADIDWSLKVFNEYNPNSDRQFGMTWGDFHDDTWDLSGCKEVIADRIAKHHILIGHSHFTGGQLLGGWYGFLNRTEQLIQWCIQNEIPIKTYSEWADVLYNQISNPYENIFPPLNVDLDANDIPDGYNQDGEGTLRKNDGVPSVNNYSYSISHVGQRCSITDLGGVEKGENEFEIWTKGATGNFIEITFKVGTQNLLYKFPAENSWWTNYHLAQSINGNTSLNIPENISLIDAIISCSNYSSGEVKISGMKLAKYQPVPIELSSFTVSNDQGVVRLKWRTITEVNNYGFDVERKKGTRELEVGSWEKIGFVPGNGNCNSPKDYSFVDKNPCGGSKFNYRLKQIDSDGKSKYSNQVEIEILPNKIELFQNYPNPFNPVTNIKFALTKKVNILLSVHNILGELVVTLLNEVKVGGYYNIKFDGSNFPNGIYILKLATEDFVQTRKMVLIK